MTGETGLDALIAGMQPVLDNRVHVFAAVPEGTDISALAPIMTFQEQEGLTVILERSMAERHALPVAFACRRITLAIHSSLEAVGFLAAITTALKEEGIAVNPVSAFHHDHLFVPDDRADDAMAVLTRLSATRRGASGH